MFVVQNVLLRMVPWVLLFSGIEAHADDKGMPPANVVSMLAVIANPKSFDGKRLVVGGFLKNEFENTAIYVSKEHAENFLSIDSIEISVRRSAASDADSDLQNTLEKSKNRYVIVEGEFSAVPDGYLSRDSGTLSKISRIQDIQTFMKSAGVKGALSPTPTTPIK